MGKRIRRQHVVSRFYLNGFANDSNGIRRVTLPGDESHLLSTTNAGVIKDFYTVTLPDGTQSDAFEQAFGQVEGPAAEALRAIESGEWPVAGERRAALAEWIALQHLRSEDVRASQGTIDAELIRLIVGTSGKAALRRVIETAEGREIPDDELDREWRDITKSGGPTLIPDTVKHIKLLVSLLDGTTGYLHDCHWSVFRFSRRALVTSDHPVSLTAGPDHPSWRGVGLATADMFLVPLARRLALAIQPRHRLPAGRGVVPDTVQQGTTLIARSINQETVLRARRYIYHHPDDSPLVGLHLPDKESHQWEATNSDGLIREEGLFHGMTDDQLKSFARDTGSGRRSKGVTINDLPWPIPGRVRPQSV